MCPCCKVLRTEPKLLYKLFAMRIILDRPIYIVSGYRCPKHNATVPGAHENSQHIYGQAADIYVPGIDFERVVEVAKYVGFKNVYVMKDKGSIHVGL